MIPDYKTGGTGFRHRSDQNRWHRISKTGGTGFGQRRTDWRPALGMEEGLGKVEGDAVMLTPCSVCAKKAGEGRSTCEANLQAATSMGKQFRPWNGSNELGDGWRTR